MDALNVSVFAADPAVREAFAKDLAKKTSVDDLGFYHTTFQGKVLSVIDPAAYPTKVQSAVYAARLTQYSVILADALTPQLGECIVLLDALGRKDGCFVTPLDVAPLVKGTCLESWPVFATAAEAKAALLSFTPVKVDGPVRALVDHSFDVKGVGTVVLGVVTQGTLKVHDKLNAQPSGKVAEIRSIQKQDKDFDSAECFDRYGAAVKNVVAADVERGTEFSVEPLKALTELTVTATASKFLKTPLGGAEGKEVLHVNNGLQTLPANLEGTLAAGATGPLKLKMSKPLALAAADRLVLLRLDAKGLRVAGRAVLA